MKAEVQSTHVSPGKIFKVIPAILKDVEAIAKTKRNEAQKFLYRSVDDVYNSIHPLLAKHGMFITTSVESENRTEHATPRGTTLFYTRVSCRFKFFADDGSHVESVLVGEAMDSGDKATNKAMSVAYKYAMFQLLCIPTEDTTADPDAQTHEVAVADDSLDVTEKMWNYLAKSPSLKELDTRMEAAEKRLEKMPAICRSYVETIYAQRSLELVTQPDARAACMALLDATTFRQKQKDLILRVALSRDDPMEYTKGQIAKVSERLEETKVASNS